jgi:hypothetical protein
MTVDISSTDLARRVDHRYPVGAVEGLLAPELAAAAPPATRNSSCTPLEAHLGCRAGAMVWALMPVESDRKKTGTASVAAPMGASMPSFLLSPEGRVFTYDLCEVLLATGGWWPISSHPAQ